MGLSNSQYQSILRKYEEQQEFNRNLDSSRYNEVCQKLPRYPELEKEIALLSIDSGRKLLSGDKQALAAYKDKLALLKKEKDDLLESGGYPPDYLDPTYTCNDCQDTGYIDRKKCQCFRNATIQLLYEQSHLKELLEKENFSTFSFDYYSTDIIDIKTNLSARDFIEDALYNCKNFIDTFGQNFQNIYLYGNTGVGKTFLINCIAKELIEKEHSVLYFTAADFIDILVTSAFEKNNVDANNLRELIYSCELLIIDDLGTEFTNSAVSTQLFACLNERYIHNKSVIISSNLSLTHLTDRYDQRITSRISGNYNILRLFGKDIRISKKQ